MGVMAGQPRFRDGILPEVRMVESRGQFGPTLLVVHREECRMQFWSDGSTAGTSAAGWVTSN